LTVSRTYYFTEEACIRAAEPDRPGNSGQQAWIDYTGTHVFTEVGTRDLSNSAEARALLRIPIIDLPADAIITSAKLVLYKSMPDGNPYSLTNTQVKVYPVTSAWVESVTWNTKPTIGTLITSFWQYASHANNYKYEIDITGTVQDWVDGTLTNNGLELLSETSSSRAWFTSKQDSLVQYRPQLVISYQGPAASETAEPAGTLDSPETVTDMVSGFDLVTNFESSTDQPIRQVQVEIYDSEENLVYEETQNFNLLTVNQESVETNTTGFTASGGASISRVTTHAWHGAASLRVYESSDDAAGVVFSAIAQAYEHYSARVHMRADSATPTPTLQMQLRVKNAGGTVLASKAIPSRTLYGDHGCAVMGLSIPPANAVNKNLAFWQEWAIEDVEAPYDAATVEVWIATAGAQAATWYIDGNTITPDVAPALWIGNGATDIPVPSGLLSYGAIYGWRSKAANADGSSGWTPLAYLECVMSTEGTPAVEVVTSEGVIRLSLAAHPAENLAGYRIYRRKQGETEWEELDALTTSVSFDDEIPASGQELEYTIAAVALDGYESPLSDVVSALLTISRTFIGSVAFDHLPSLERISRPFVGRSSPVLGSMYLAVNSQSSARNFELGCWVKGKTNYEALDALLNSNARIRYIDPFGESFYFRIIGDIDADTWPREELYNVKVRIAEVE
jgi:hypothetical protein